MNQSAFRALLYGSSTYALNFFVSFFPFKCFSSLKSWDLFFWTGNEDINREMLYQVDVVTMILAALNALLLNSLSKRRSCILLWWNVVSYCWKNRFTINQEFSWAFFSSMTRSFLFQEEVRDSSFAYMQRNSDSKLYEILSNLHCSFFILHNCTLLLCL